MIRTMCDLSRAAEQSVSILPLVSSCDCSVSFSQVKQPFVHTAPRQQLPPITYTRLILLLLGPSYVQLYFSRLGLEVTLTFD